MDHLRPDLDHLRGPDGSTGGAALDRAIDGVAQAGLANRRRVEGAEEAVRRAANRLREFDARQHAADQRATAALRYPL
eukprot:8381629-Alexandrium_andersonii.AAC.1